MTAPEKAAAAESQWMSRALLLAERGRGSVEPNPMVGCVLVRDGAAVGEGWHRRLGGPHAEVEALRAAGDKARGATAYVSLEPCAHHGRTPPCTEALIGAGVARVVAAMQDPFPQVAGRGLQQLRQAGVDVKCGLLEAESRRLNAPYLRRVRDGRPWVIAKWAMTLDGRLAAPGGDSRWISNPRSRQVVHQLRGRVDAVIVGSGTALADDPQLTARPPGPRQAVRIVCDRRLRLPLDSQLVRTAGELPVLVACLDNSDAQRRQQLQQAGCELLTLPADANSATMLELLLQELGRREMTNVLVEGGGRLLGELFDAELIDEAWAFVAPKLIGGAEAGGPLAGAGLARMSQAARLRDLQIEQLDGDVLVRGVVDRG